MSGQWLKDAFLSAENWTTETQDKNKESKLPVRQLLGCVLSAGHQVIGIWYLAPAIRASQIRMAQEKGRLS